MPRSPQKKKTSTAASDSPNYFRLALLFIALSAVLFGLYSTSNGSARLRRSPVDTIPTRCNADATVALTFDEGPGPSTGIIIQDLDAKQVKATFHPTVQYIHTIAMETHVKTLFQRGHTIGLRLTPTINPMELSEEQLAKTLILESQKIKNVIGKHPKFLRLPDKQIDEKVLNVARKLGFVVTKWNVDLNDWSATANDFIKMKNILAEQMDMVVSKASFIVLLHDIAPYSYLGSAEVTKLVKDRAYNAVTLNQCLGVEPYRKDEENVFVQSMVANPSGAVGMGVGFLGLALVILGMLM